MDMMHLTKDDLCEAAEDVVGAMEFMAMSEGMDQKNSFQEEK